MNPRHTAHNRYCIGISFHPASQNAECIRFIRNPVHQTAKSFSLSLTLHMPISPHLKTDYTHFTHRFYPDYTRTGPVYATFQLCRFTAAAIPAQGASFVCGRGMHTIYENAGAMAETTAPAFFSLNPAFCRPAHPFTRKMICIRLIIRFCVSGIFSAEQSFPRAKARQDLTRPTGSPYPPSEGSSHSESFRHCKGDPLPLHIHAHFHIG